MNTRGIGKRILQGMGVGVADLVPGVSGATIALILGIYEKLILELSGLLRRPRSFADLRTNLDRDWRFLLPLLIGAGLSIGLGAMIIPGLVETQPLIVFGLFSGLIASSAFVLARDLHGPPSSIGWLLAGAAFGASIAMIPVGIEAHTTPLATIGAGAAAVSAMLMPGISGSYLLLLLGYYTHVLSAISAADWRFLALFGLGGIVGAAVSITLIGRLLRAYHLQAMLVLIGVIIGALGKPLGIAFAAATGTADRLVLAFVFALGAGLTFLVARR